MTRAHRMVFVLAVVIALAGVTSTAFVDSGAVGTSPVRTGAVVSDDLRLSLPPGESPATPAGRGSTAVAAAAGADRETAAQSSPASPSGSTAEVAAAGASRQDAAEMKTGDLPIEVSVDPGCATLGQKLVAHVKAAPGAYVSLVVAYADGRNYGEMYAGPVASDGSLTYPWVPPPAAAIGQGRVLVAGHDPARESSGTNGAFFLIEGAKGC